MPRGARAQRGWVRKPLQTDTPPTTPEQSTRPRGKGKRNLARTPRPPTLAGYDSWDALPTPPDSRKVTPVHYPNVTDIPEGCDGLVNWDGTWAPAPLEWDNVRPGFSLSDQRIKDWISNSTKALEGCYVPMPLKHTCTENGALKEYVFTETEPSNADVMVDVVPRYWIPENLEHNFNANTFWEWFKHEMPLALCSYEQDDLVKGRTQPWWQTYPSKSAWYHIADSFQAPVELGPDEAVEGGRITAARLADKGGNHAIAKREAHLRKKAEERKKKEEAKRQSVAAQWPSLDPNTPDELALVPTRIPRNKSRKRILIRSAQLSDAPQLRHIYNHYVRTSCAVPGPGELSGGAIQSEISWSQDSSLPYLVAVRADSNHILGFASCMDYNDQKGLFRYAVELSIFVRPEEVRKGVAGFLMDQMLTIIDTEHVGNFVNNVNVADDVLMHVRRPIRNIIINLSFARKHKPEWLFAWLANLGWEQAGLLKDMGNKHGQTVDMAIMQRVTGTPIEVPKPIVCDPHPRMRRR